MKRLLLLLPLLFCLSQPAQAQDDDEGTRLERLIENALSSEGTQVTVRGFRGALSSQATMERMTIADEDGIWLTLENAELDWSRLALLRGRLQVDTLSAERLEVARTPTSNTETPAPEASGQPFSLPDLPVSVNVGEFRVDRVELGAPLIGEPVVLTVSGAAQLADGEGNVELDVQRVDGPRDALTFAGSYANESRQLAIDLVLDEASGGLLTTKANLPGAPDLRLTLQGEGPIDDFTAALALATEGEDRFAGDITLQGSVGADHRFAADLSGDLRPLLPEEQRAFLGDNQLLRTSGVVEAAGAIELDTLELRTAAVDLTGAARIGADGWPERLALDGRIASEDGSPVTLAFTSDVTRIDEAVLTLSYDRAQGDGFTLEVLAQGIDRPELALREAKISGEGTISRNADSAAPGEIAGRLQLAVDGLALADENLQSAAGDALEGALAFDWQQGNGFDLTDIDIAGAGIAITGDVAFSGFAEGEDPAIEPNLAIRTDDIARFSGLAGRDLGGAAAFDLEARAEPVSGRFDVTLSGTATDLSADIPQVDGLLAGELTLALAAERNEQGTFLRNLDLDGDGIVMTASGELRTGASTGSFDLSLPDLSRVQDGMSGPLTLKGDLQESASAYTLDFTAAAPGRTALDGVLTATKDEAGSVESLSFNGTAASDELAAFAALAGRPLRGSASFEGQGSYALDDGTASAIGTLVTQDVGIGIPQADGLLEGRVTMNVDGTRSNEGIFLRTLEIDGPAITLDAQGEMVPDASTATFDLVLSDLAKMQDGMSGSAALKGDLKENGEAYVVTFSATGPGETAAQGVVTAGKTDAGEIASVAFDGTASARRLSAFAPLTRQALRGSLDFDGEGSYSLSDGSARADGTLTTQDLGLGIPTADQLIGGTGRAVVSASRDADGTITVQQFDLSTAEITASASGSLGQSGDSALTFDVALRDLGLLVEQLPGRATASGTVSATGTGPYQINTSLSAPGGTQAQVSGSIARSFDSANIAVNGNAPLSLANRIAEPNLLNGTARIDLRLNGPLAVSSLSGSVRVNGADIVLPGPALTLTGVDIDTQLGGGQAQLTVEGALSSGGSLRSQGTIGLTSPYNADLRVRLRDLLLQDRRLYQATASGNVTVQGPLLTGPAIGGWVEVEQAEIRIPETGLGPGSRSFTLTHVREPAPVRQTRVRAGLVETEQQGRGSSYTLPLDLEIRAPQQIFVRGRGLDAELGGSLTLTGTSDDIVPSGQFELIRGRLDILGQRLVLEKAILQLTGDFIPTIDVLATTDVESATVSVALQGEATSPEVTFSSDPARPEEEVLALLLFGRDLGELSALQALQIASAVNSLAGRGGEGIIGNLRQGFGLDDFDVTTDSEGNAGLRLGKYITEKVYTDVEVSSGESSINLNYQINRNIKAQTSATSDGDTTLGIFFEKDY